MVSIFQLDSLSQVSFLNLVPDLPIVTLLEKVVSQFLLLSGGNLDGWLLDSHFFKGVSPELLRWIDHTIVNCLVLIGVAIPRLTGLTQLIDSCKLIKSISSLIGTSYALSIMETLGMSPSFQVVLLLVQLILLSQSELLSFGGIFL